MIRTLTEASRFLAILAVSFTVGGNDARANGEGARARRMFADARKARRLANGLAALAVSLKGGK